MMDSPSISYIRRNHSKIIISLDIGAEIVSKLAHSAIGDGVRSIDIRVENNIYAISCDRQWLVREAFEVLIPYPTLAINSSRLEILVSAFADWFAVKDDSGEVFSHGVKPAFADEVLCKLNSPQSLVFHIDPDPSRQLWRAKTT